MIDCNMFTVQGLLEALLCDPSEMNRDMHNDTWRVYCEIIPEHKAQNGKLKCVVRCGDVFLRHSYGPKQGYFWDAYGDDFLTPELALMALLHAPVPQRFLRAHIHKRRIVDGGTR